MSVSMISNYIVLGLALFTILFVRSDHLEVDEKNIAEDEMELMNVEQVKVEKENEKEVI
jgi:hypothetical protein